MDASPKLSREEFVARMQSSVAQVLGQIADAINDAAPGQVVAASQEKVRDPFADLRRQAFALGLQMPIDAAEAAFPPSESPDHRHEATQ
jgi:hypothetical protein